MGETLDVSVTDLRADKVLQGHMRAGSLLAVGSQMSKFDGRFPSNPSVVRGGPTGKAGRSVPPSPDPFLQALELLVDQQKKMVTLLQGMTEELREVREALNRAPVATAIPQGSVRVSEKKKGDDDMVFIPTKLVGDKQIRVDSSQGSNPELDDSIARLREMKRKKDA